MSYTLFHESIQHVQRIHEQAGFPTEYRPLARYLGVKVRLKDTNFSFVREDGQPFLVLNFENYNRRISFSAMHELAHLILKAAGFEWALYSEHQDARLVDAYLEKFCDVAATRMLAPHHFVEEAIDRWGYSPMAVMHLSNRTRLDLQKAMNLIIHHDRNASVAGFITSGKTVLHQSRQNCQLPFRKWDRLPESHPVFKAKTNVNTLFQVEDAELICTRIAGTQKRMGLVVGTT